MYSISINIYHCSFFNFDRNRTARPWLIQILTADFPFPIPIPPEVPHTHTRTLTSRGDRAQLFYRLHATQTTELIAISRMYVAPRMCTELNRIRYSYVCAVNAELF